MGCVRRPQILVWNTLTKVSKLHYTVVSAFRPISGLPMLVSSPSRQIERAGDKHGAHCPVIKDDQY
jgi:hypothetical protein